VLRAVRSAPPHTPPALWVIGVDDFARRKGQIYGTLIVDLERRRPIEILADRSAATLATWLQTQPGLEIICSDRSTEYARGFASGAPQVQAVADRWHRLVRRFIHGAIPVTDGKGSEGNLWVNGLPCGESQGEQEHAA
jgi:transposase